MIFGESSEVKITTKYQVKVLPIAVALPVLLFSLAGVFFCPPLLGQGESCEEAVVAKVGIDGGHLWRAPFGLDKVGQPATAIVEISSDRPPLREYTLVGYLNGKEVGRFTLNFTGDKAKFISRVSFETYPNELALFAKCLFKGESVEVAREKVQPPPFEAEAVARPSEVVNPVDLGAILVPHDWLLLGPGQKGEVEVAALARAGDIPGARVTAWFESAPKQRASAEIKLTEGTRAQVKLLLPLVTPTVDHDRLQVTITKAGGKPIWQKQIETMFVRKAPPWPQFGAVETKLRYDLPISVRDPNTGERSTLPYEKGWPDHFNDVVVTFPHGERFVFWRGDSYAPFWASRYNTGLCYEWAETSPPPEGYVDSVEPLMDKELRYSRVKILESTPSRVHVRWSYQSCDFNYKVFGDAAQEDFYFYPDGFGTRVMTLKSVPGADYELSEFIILSPPRPTPLKCCGRRWWICCSSMAGSARSSSPTSARKESTRGRILCSKKLIPRPSFTGSG
jgi:hypothetical protein